MKVRENALLEQKYSLYAKLAQVWSWFSPGLDLSLYFHSYVLDETKFSPC